MRALIPLALATGLTCSPVAAQPTSRPTSRGSTNQISSERRAELEQKLRDATKMLGRFEAKTLRQSVPDWVRAAVDQKLGGPLDCSDRSALQKARTLIESIPPNSAFATFRPLQLRHLASVLWQVDGLALRPDCPRELLPKLAEAYYTAGCVARAGFTSGGILYRFAADSAMLSGVRLSRDQRTGLPGIWRNLIPVFAHLQIRATARLLAAPKVTKPLLSNLSQAFANLDRPKEAFWSLSMSHALGNQPRSTFTACRVAMAMAQTLQIANARGALKAASQLLSAEDAVRQNAALFALRRATQAVDAAERYKKLAASEALGDRVEAGHALIQMGRHPLAYRTFMRLIAEHPQDPGVLVGTGLAAKYFGHLGTAEQALGRALQAGAKDPRLPELQLWVLSHQVINLFRRVANGNKEARESLLQTTVRIRKAIDLHRPRPPGLDVLEIGARLTEGTLRSGSELQLTDLFACLRTLAPEILRVRDAHPEDLTTHQAALAAALVMTDRSRARQVLRAKLPADHPRVPSLAVGRAELMFARLHGLEERDADAALQTVLQDLPAGCGLRPILLGNLLAIRASRRGGEDAAWQRAIELFRKAAKDKAFAAQAHNNLGIALLAVKQAGAARAAFQKSVHLGNDGKGIARLNALLCAEAKSAPQDRYQKLVALDPGARASASLLAWLVHGALENKDPQSALGYARRLLATPDLQGEPRLTTTVRLAAWLTLPAPIQRADIEKLVSEAGKKPGK